MSLQLLTVRFTKKYASFFTFAKLLACISTVLYDFEQVHLSFNSRTVYAMLAAAVYIACREMGISKTLNGIATAADITRKDLSNIFVVILAAVLGIFL